MKRAAGPAASPGSPSAGSSASSSSRAAWPCRRVASRVPGSAPERRRRKSSMLSRMTALAACGGVGPYRRLGGHAQPRADDQAMYRAEKRFGVGLVERHRRLLHARRRGGEPLRDPHQRVSRRDGVHGPRRGVRVRRAVAHALRRRNAVRDEGIENDDHFPGQTRLAAVDLEQHVEVELVDRLSRADPYDRLSALARRHRDGDAGQHVRPRNAEPVVGGDVGQRCADAGEILLAHRHELDVGTERLAVGTTRRPGRRARWRVRPARRAAASTARAAGRAGRADASRVVRSDRLSWAPHSPRGLMGRSTASAGTAGCVESRPTRSARK